MVDERGRRAVPDELGLVDIAVVQDMRAVLLTERLQPLPCGVLIHGLLEEILLVEQSGSLWDQLLCEEPEALPFGVLDLTGPSSGRLVLVAVDYDFVLQIKSPAVLPPDLHLFR